MTDEPTHACVLHSKPVAASVGNLCPGHLQALSTMLRDIEEHAALLTAVPSFQQRNSNRGATLASTRSPARLDVLCHLDPRTGTGWAEEPGDTLAAGHTLSILGLLGHYADRVRGERQYTERAQRTITGERDFLTRHLDYIAATPWVRDFHGHIRALASQLKAANGHRPTRPLTRCVVRYDTGLCGGSIWEQEIQQLVHMADGSRQWMQVPGGPASCDLCGAAWDADADKARLQLMVEQEHAEKTRPRTEDGRRMLTVAELAAQAGTKVDTMRVRLHRAKAVPVRGHYDPAIIGLSDLTRQAG